MSNQERDRFNQHEAFSERELAEAARDQHDKLRAEREKSLEKSHENDAERARHEALEHAAAAKENEPVRHESRERSPAERHITKKDRQVSYDKKMEEVRSHMSAPSKAFSRMIHAPTVEKASDAIGGTIARPNAILAGALLAFLLTLGVYLVARMNGYPLSGAETIAAFALGWLIGLAYDFIKVMVLGRR